MEVKQIKTLSQLEGLISQFFKKDTFTNNYMLLDSYKQHISDGNLFYFNGDKNLVLFLYKKDFYQMYYYLNDLSERLNFEITIPVVMEILYRGNQNPPEDILRYWETVSFKRHLERDLLTISSKNVIWPQQINENVKIYLAHTEADIKYVFEAIINNFDAYTGDIFTYDEVKSFIQNGQVWVATIDESPCGLLQMESKNNVSWLGHIVVDPKYRNQKIANSLVATWIRETANHDNHRFQLWVIKNNRPAVNLYRNFGFTYLNKSTISMLKI